MSKNNSSKEQIEWEKNGGIPPGKGEYRNQERGKSETVSKEKLEKFIKELNNKN